MLTFGRSVANVARRWSVDQVRVIYSPDSRAPLWRIEGRCVANDHPVASWRVGDYFLLASHLDLGTAMALALKGPKR